jgi:hypothetical protein
MRFLVSVLVVGIVTPVTVGQGPAHPPVIDVHVHSTNTTPQQALDRMKALNIRLLVVSALTTDLPVWSTTLTSDQYLPGLVFPCAGGRAPITGRPCFNESTDFPNLAWLTGELKGGRIRVLGEVEPQYLGMPPGDSRLEPYWELAEQLDVPVAIHMGPGPPGVAYESSPVPFKSPEYRMAMGDPLLLEDVLLRHKRLRLSVMHAGWPKLESMVALLYAHPNVYVDTAALQDQTLVPRPAYYRHLRGLIEAGFGKRIMFGSDFPNRVEAGIDAILQADFLSGDQKADILCNNAARYLRIGASICNP